jgi:hypothetical protein
MDLVKTHVSRSWMLATFLPLLVQSQLLGQDVPPGDSAGFNHSRMTHHLEVGFNAIGAGLGYRYQWFPFLSTDAVVSVANPGAALGVTVSALWMFYVQGVVGTGSYDNPSTPDGPAPIKPTYLYGWNAGVHFPIAPKKTRLYFIFAFGQLKYVQDHYQYNGGGFLVGPPPTPLYRTETKVVEVFSLGLGTSF